MKMHIIARSCITPGIFTLLNNLVTSYAEDKDEKMALDEERMRAGRGAKLFSSWEGEYMNGVKHEIYRVKLSSAFEVCEGDILATIHNHHHLQPPR
jgi:hypothetical protein